MEEARRRVRIEVEDLRMPPIPGRFACRERKRSGATTTFSKPYSIEKGDIERGFAEADLIVESEYETGAQEQLYIETNGMIADGESERGRHRLGLDAVPLLRPQGADPDLSICRPKRFA